MKELTGGGALLTDALESTHGWGETPTGVVPTSVSSARSEHIDYLFYDSRNLFLKEVLLEMPDSPTPNKVEPSDHMPVGAKFQWARQHTQLPPLSAASAGFSSGTVMASMIAAVFAASVFTNLQAKL